MSSNKKLDKTGLSVLWTRNFSLIKRLTGDVDVAGKGTLQAQIDKIQDTLESTPAELHRILYRGKNLGTSVTATQKAHIQDGTFEDLWLGDYWVINSVTWRIVDIDYWYNCGDTAFLKHHLVIMPDKCLYNAQMNTADITTGGYVDSAMYKTNLAAAKTTINNAFNGLVLSHREYLTNAVTNGYISGGAWYDSTVELPNEIMMYGSYVFISASTGSMVPNLYTINKNQLALFQVVPKYITNRESHWLRDAVATDFFAVMDEVGTPAYHFASSSRGVRPVFAIGL